MSRSLSETTSPPVAAIASLANPAGVNNYLVWYNDSTTAQLLALTQAYTDVRGLIGEQPVHHHGLQFGPADVPSGNILPKSALTAVVHNGTVSSNYLGWHNTSQSKC